MYLVERSVMCSNPNHVSASRQTVPCILDHIHPPASLDHQSYGIVVLDRSDILLVLPVLAPFWGLLVAVADGAIFESTSKCTK